MIVRGMRTEHGSVSIVAAALMSVTLMIAMGAADLARVLTTAARAQTAADVAALAAAQELALPAGDSSPAEIAAIFAARNDAVLTACSCEAGGSEAIVTVAVQVGALSFAADDRVVTARARAVVQVPPEPTGVNATGRASRSAPSSELLPARALVDEDRRNDAGMATARSS